MQPCEGNACDYVELWNHDSVWVVENLHLSRSVRVEFDGLWGGLSHTVDLQPREERILSFKEFFGNWHANFIHKS